MLMFRRCNYIWSTVVYFTMSTYMYTFVPLYISDDLLPYIKWIDMVSLLCFLLLFAGTDTGGSVRVPAAFCGILGFRPSHAVLSTAGVIPMAQSFDTVGWFARDPVILNRVGRVLLQIPDADSVQPSCFLVPDDCFQLLNIPSDRLTQVIINSVEKLFGFGIVKHMNLGNYISERVPSLDHFMDKGNEHQEYIPSLIALSSAMRCLPRYEFKTNHGEWITSIKPKFGPGISERVLEAIKTTDEGIDICKSVKTEFRTSLTSLLEVFSLKKQILS
ncbi:amidase [Ranunculus cassubicifolius]